MTRSTLAISLMLLSSIGTIATAAQANNEKEKVCTVERTRETTKREATETPGKGGTEVQVKEYQERVTDYKCKESSKDKGRGDRRDASGHKI